MLPSPPAAATSSPVAVALSMPKEEAAARIGGSAPASSVLVELDETRTTLSVRFRPVSNLLETALKRFTG